MEMCAMLLDCLLLGDTEDEDNHVDSLASLTIV